MNRRSYMDMKRFIQLVAVLSCICLVSCSKEGNDKLMYITAAKSRVSVKVGATSQIVLNTITESGATAEYDLAKNELQIEFTSSAPSVATVSSTGLITALARGNAIITASSKTDDLRCTVNCSVERAGALYDLSAKWDDDMAFFCSSLGGMSDAQCFDVDSKGNIWHAVTKLRGEVGFLTIIKSAPSGEILGEMQLYYASHGQTFSVEEAADGDYIWVPNCGVVNSDGRGYGTARTASRIKFEPGTSKTPEDLASSSFCMNGKTGVDISIDKISGNVAFCWYESSTYYVNIYTKESMLNAPLTDVSLNVTRGSSPRGQITDSKSVTVKMRLHELSGVKALYSFSVPKSSVVGKTAAGKAMRNQGFCFYDGLCYFVSDSDGALRDAHLSSVKLDGTVLQKPTHIAAIDDAAALYACGFGVSNGYFESEGLQFINDKLHTGYLCWEDGVCKNAILRLH